MYMMAGSYSYLSRETWIWYNRTKNKESNVDTMEYLLVAYLHNDFA